MEVHFSVMILRDTFIKFGKKFNYWTNINNYIFENIIIRNLYIRNI